MQYFSFLHAQVLWLGYQLRTLHCAISWLLSRETQICQMECLHSQLLFNLRQGCPSPLCHGCRACPTWAPPPRCHVCLLRSIQKLPVEDHCCPQVCLTGLISDGQVPIQRLPVKRPEPAKAAASGDKKANTKKRARVAAGSTALLALFCFFVFMGPQPYWPGSDSISASRSLVCSSVSHCNALIVWKDDPA